MIRYKMIEPFKVNYGHQISTMYYSNCLIEAVLHWMRHPLTTKIYCVLPRNNEAHCYHFYWKQSGRYFDFTSEEIGTDFHWWEVILFHGYIREFTEYEKRKRKHRNDID